MERAIAELSPMLRRRIADEWARDARAEHEGIALFSHLSLQLMALGAPPDLLRGAHGAALDEIEHARRCLHFASLYRGETVTAERLPSDADALGGSEPLEFMRVAVRAGCVGDALAAFVARAAAEAAGIEELRGFLNEIAEAEARHSELTYRVVRWALAGHPEWSSAVRAAFADVLGEAHREPDADPDAARMAEHGRLDACTRWKLRRRAIVELITPAMDALF